MASRIPSIGLGVVAIFFSGAGAAFAADLCTCVTTTGERVELGKLACLKTDKGMREARCGLVLNNTSWFFTGNQCPVAWYGGRPNQKAELAIFRSR